MKTKVLLIILLALSLLVSCNKKQLQKKPAQLIPVEKMTDIIAESYLIESMINFSSGDSSKQALTQNLYADLFRKYGITKEQYISSITYYLSEKDQANEILTESSEKLNQKQETILE